MINQDYYEIDCIRWHNSDIFASLLDCHESGIYICESDEFQNNKFRYRSYPPIFYFTHLYKPHPKNDSLEMFLKYKMVFIQRYEELLEEKIERIELLFVDTESFVQVPLELQNELKNRMFLGVRINGDILITRDICFKLFYLEEYEYNSYFGEY